MLFSQVSLQPRVTEEELYELSLAREPRSHTHSVSLVVKRFSMVWFSLSDPVMFSKRELSLFFFRTLVGNIYLLVK